MIAKNVLQARARKFFSGVDADFALFYNTDSTGNTDANFSYFSGTEVDGSVLLLRRNATGMLLTSGMNYEKARILSPYPVVKFTRTKAYEEIRKLAGGQAKKCGVDFASVSAYRYLSARKKLKAKLIDVSEAASAARGTKDESEIMEIRKAVKIGKEILEEIDPFEYATELEVSKALKIMALEKGCDISFPPIAAANENSRLPHHEPSAKKIGEGIVLIDFGVKYEGYCSDLSRCYFKGEAKKERQAYLKMQEMYDEIIGGLGACKYGRDVSRLADNVYKRHKQPALIHCIGHGIGRQVHEYPHLGQKSKDKVGSGTVLAIEPGAYFAKFGVRYENEVLIKVGKTRTL